LHLFAQADNAVTNFICKKICIKLTFIWQTNLQME